MKPHPKPYGSPVVGYVRSARRGDAALDEAEAQIRAYCAEQGWNLAKVFREEGVSSVAAWRPRFEEMVRGLERREWVDLVIHYSNRQDLADDLSRCLRRLRQSDIIHSPVRLSVRSTGRSDRRWRVSDRLTEADIAAMVASARDGVSKIALAERFKISHSSVKRILKEHDVRYGTGRYRRS